MKHRFNTGAALLLAAASLFFTSCSKDSEAPCTELTAFVDPPFTVSAAVLAAAPEFSDSLSKYPQLLPYRDHADERSVLLHCRVFHEGLIVFTSNYMLYKARANGSVGMSGGIPDDIHIGLTPALSSGDAVARAREELDFGNECITYRLGIADINAGTGVAERAYKLVWRIEGRGNTAKGVTLDAMDGTVYASFDGIFE